MPRRAKSTTTRSKARSNYRRSKRRALQIKVQPKIAREIWAIIYFAVGVLTILSIQGGLGVIGDAWIKLLNPIFGWGVYVIPGLFIVLSIMMFFSKKVHFGAS